MATLVRENGGLLSEGGITNEILYFFFSCKQGQVYNKGGGGEMLGYVHHKSVALQ